MRQILKIAESFRVNQVKINKGKPMAASEAPNVTPKHSLGIIGRLPNGSRGRKYSNVDRANRFLHFQELRISKAISNGEIDKAVIIFLCLLKCSKAYQLLLFNRCVKNGYGKMSTEYAEKTLFGAMNKLRSSDFTLLINRFYILKKSGKGRPIGSPNYESRMISKALTDLLYACIEKDRDPEQHGYTKFKGTGSAILSVIEKLKEGYDGYEFDLKSFFNTVEPYIYLKKLEEISKILTKVIGITIKNIEYRYGELKEESELHMKKANVIERTGVPQGLSLSPLISTGALEYYGRPKELVMYADDGIFFYKHNLSKFIKWIGKLENAGIKIAPEKSGPLSEEFRFCGCTINRIEETIEFRNLKISGHDKDLRNGLMKINNLIYMKPKEGRGEIHDEAFIKHRILNINGSTGLKALGNFIMYRKDGKGYRIFKGDLRAYDILGSSSGAVNEQLKRIKYRKGLLAKIKALDLSTTKYAEIFSYDAKEKGKYKRYFDDGGSNQPPKPERKYWEILQYHNLNLMRVKPKFRR